MENAVIAAIPCRSVVVPWSARMLRSGPTGQARAHRP